MDVSEKKLRVKLDEIINDKSNWENHSYTVGSENIKIDDSWLNDKKVINEIVEYLKGENCLSRQ